MIRTAIVALAITAEAVARLVRPADPAVQIARIEARDRRHARRHEIRMRRWPEPDREEK